MCVEIWLDGDLIESVGQMRAKLGREPVFLDGATPQSVGDECCLCIISLDATAALLGRVCERECEGVGFVFTLPQPPEDAR